jgi:hypothetical protein
MLTSRKIELGLAALIASGAWFATMVPGAQSDSSRLEMLSQMRPTVNPSDFDNLKMSDSTRHATRALMRTSDRDPTPLDFWSNGSDGSQTTLSFEPRVPSRDVDDDAIVGSGLGFTVRAQAPADSEISKWSVIGGAGQESFAITPSGRREMVLVPVAVESSVGDAHFGVGYEINDNAYATLGYVREDRHFTAGNKGWGEKEHFVGISVHARW